MKLSKEKSQIIKVVLTSLIAALACVGIIQAATTVGVNISTTGTLDVTGVSTLTGNTAITGTLGVTGLTTFGNASSTVLTVSGNSYLATTTMSGNLILQSLSTFPTSPTAGQMFYSTASSTPHFYDEGNSRWIGLDSREDAAFIVYALGSNYIVKNGSTGIVDYSGTDAVAAIQWAVDNLTAGRTSKEKVVLSGDFTIGSAVSGVDSTVDIPSYTVIDCENNATLTATNDIHADNITSATERALFENSDSTNGNKSIEILNCVIDGNDNFGDGEDTQTNAFQLVDFRVNSKAISEAFKTLGDTCTLKASKISRSVEYFDMVIKVDTTSTFKYSINSGIDYHNTNGADSVSIQTSTTGNVTASDSSGDLLLTLSSHGLNDGETILFATTGTLPDALSLLTAYWVEAVDGNTFKVSESYEAYRDAVYVATDLTNSSGTHTFWQTQKVDRGIYVSFSADSCDATGDTDTWTLSSNVVSDVEFTGNTLKSSSGAGILLRDVTEFRIENNDCDGMEDDCYRTDESVSMGYILNNFTNNTDSSGIEINDSPSNLLISGNTIRNARSDGTTSGGVGLNMVVQGTQSNQVFGDNVTMINNNIYENYSQGLNVVNNVSGGMKYQNIIIKNNTVRDSGKNNTSCSGLNIGNVDGGVVDSNFSYNNGDANNERGISVQSCNNIRISNNTSYNNSCEGIRASDVTNSIFDGNVIYDNGISQDCWGLYLVGNGTSASNIITNNVLSKKTTRTSGFNQYGIQVETGVVDTIVSNNHVRNAESSLYFTDDGTSTSFDLNYGNNKPTSSYGVSDVDCGTAVNHGLYTTPDYVIITAGDTGTSDLYASSIGTTQFTISCTDTGDDAYNFSWRAVYVP